MTAWEKLTIAKDVLLGIAAVVTSTVAIFGLRNWSRELKGKTEFETARNLARATYRLRDAIQSCRAPFTSRSEYPAHLQHVESLSPEQEAEAYRHLHKNRWIPVSKALQEFDSHSLEAEALWGEPIRTKTNQMRQCLNELSVAINTLVDDKASGGETFKADKEFARENRSVVYSSGGNGRNEFSGKITAAIAAIEDQVRPHLRRR